MKRKLFYFLFGILLYFIPSQCLALNEVNVYFFYSPDCNFCSQEKAFLMALQKDKYPNMRIYYYDTSSDNNLALMNQAKEMYDVTNNGIPFTIIGDKAYIGFSQSKKCSIQKDIYYYSYNTYQNKFGTDVVQISYRTDLVGDVEEYNGEDDYIIEESPTLDYEIIETEEKDIFDDPKFQATLILGGLIFFLVLLFLIVKLVERSRQK